METNFTSEQITPQRENGENGAGYDDDYVIDEILAFVIIMFEIKRVEGGEAGWISSTCVHSVHNVYTLAVDPSSLLRL